MFRTVFAVALACACSEPSSSPGTPDAGPRGIRPGTPGLELYYDFEADDRHEIPDAASPTGPRMHALDAVIGADGRFGRGLVSDNRGATYGNGAYATPPREMVQRFHTTGTLELWARQESRDKDDLVAQFGFLSVVVAPDFAYCVATTDNGEPPSNITVWGAGVPKTLLDLPTDRWTHLGCTYDGTRVALHVDGVLRESPSTANTLGNKYSNPMPLGASAGQPFAPVDSPFDLDVARGPKFVGRLDEVALWSTARTGEELCRDAGGIPAAGNCTLP